MEAGSDPGLLEKPETFTSSTPLPPETAIAEWFVCEETNRQSIAPQFVTLFKFWLVISSQLESQLSDICL